MLPKRRFPGKLCFYSKYALSELKAEPAIAEHSDLRQIKYLNNLVEQDHRLIKQLVRLELGFFSFQTAW